MATFLSIFIWFCFFVFLEFVLVFCFVTFLYFFYFVKFEWDRMLASRLWRGLLFLIYSNSTFFMSILHAFYCHLNNNLIQFYWLLLLESVLKFPALTSCVLWKLVIWLLLQFKWLVATGCHVIFFFRLAFTLLLCSSFCGYF